MRRRYVCGAIVGVLATAGALTTAFGASAAPASSHAQAAKPSIMRPLGFKPVQHSKPARPRRTNNLAYQGGVGGIGVETSPKVYLVLWGSQWSSDPSGESAILPNFFNHAGGSSWLNSVTQYCQGVAPGTITCGSLGQHAGNPSAIYGGMFQDNGSAAPARPTQTQLANEAVRAAAYFHNTTSGSNAAVQYVVATAHNNNASGFGTQYCAWHSSTSSSYGNIAYTNLPYITDAGASCGANFVNGGSSGATDGITIVEGHEMAETITDQFPNGGWLDGSGEENGDKCAWSSATSNQSLGGTSFPVQPLWSNAFNNNSGGCVLSYP
jgi:serine protease